MDLHNTDDAVTRRIKALTDRVSMLKEHDLYFYNQPVEELLDDSKVRVRGRVMGMYASYGYLGLLNHPRIVFLDEASSAMDEGLEHAMYELLRESLPETIMVSVGHRSTLVEFHTRELELLGGGRWQLRELSATGAV